MTTAVCRLGFITSAAIGVRGPGYLAGELPPVPNPDELDGRARILNVPSHVRITVFDRRSMIPVAATMSAADGTWRVDYLHPDLFFLVLATDGRRMVNAAVQDWVQPWRLES